MASAPPAKGERTPSWSPARPARRVLLLSNRPDVGCLLFDSGVAVDRFVEATRGEDRIAELAGARQRFSPWRALPLSPLDWSP